MPSRAGTLLQRSKRFVGNSWTISLPTVPKRQAWRLMLPKRSGRAFRSVENRIPILSLVPSEEKRTAIVRGTRGKKNRQCRDRRARHP